MFRGRQTFQIGRAARLRLGPMPAHQYHRLGHDSLLVGKKPGTTGTFGTTPVTWQYDFSATQLAALGSYITNGSDLAIGLDSGCHFRDTSIRLEIYTALDQAAIPGRCSVRASPTS